MGRAFEYRKASKMARWDKMAKTFSKRHLVSKTKKNKTTSFRSSFSLVIFYNVAISSSVISIL